MPSAICSVGCRLKKAMETTVVSSMASEAANTLTMLSANFITHDTSRPLQARRGRWGRRGAGHGGYAWLAAGWAPSGAC